MTTVTLDAPVAAYLLALVFDENMRSAAMDAHVAPQLAEVLYPGMGEFVSPLDAPAIAREAFQASIWATA